MESLLGALVAFGAVITIELGVGALAFCAVVILTMFAAETFDPRLMCKAVASARDSAWVTAACIAASAVGEAITPEYELLIPLKAIKADRSWAHLSGTQNHATTEARATRGRS
jgi:hypothetical protein